MPIPFHDSTIRSDLGLLRNHIQRVIELVRAIENYQKSTDALAGGTAGVDRSRLTVSTLSQIPRKLISA